MKQFITPTAVQHELNVEREFEHEFMNPQQSMAVNYVQLSQYPRVRSNVQLQVSQKLLAQLGKITSVRWYCTDQSVEEILQQFNVSFIRYQTLIKCYTNYAELVSAADRSNLQLDLYNKYSNQKFTI